MLKKENRLKNKKAFIATYNNGIAVGNDIMVIYAGKPKTDKNCPTRVGFVVSKKVHKRAVKRNKAKRLMREVVRLMFKNSEDIAKISNHQSMIFIAKENILEKSLVDIRNTILILLDKLAKKNI